MLAAIILRVRRGEVFTAPRLLLARRSIRQCNSPAQFMAQIAEILSLRERRIALPGPCGA
jgi:hypothetical protein